MKLLLYRSSGDFLLRFLYFRHDDLPTLKMELELSLRPYNHFFIVYSIVSSNALSGLRAIADDILDGSHFAYILGLLQSVFIKLIFLYLKVY